ncbi:TonB-dependent receptor [Phenylobacterium montanum]|uniref:TonB-dependent receptor n=1 Tax=Phenylobacterium montanum TaxID=2823693 RepID=A0A975G0V1_9CAUL|nr:TonB-dependent receptor [Caulobacter sp. S6]QUD88840.1 TonB-dependent receptor [Caulobacter sp. S6]
MPRNSALRRLLLATTAFAAPMVCGAAAFAQTAAPAPAKAKPQDTTEIIVTATRQSQALSKVPLSVSAFTAAKMDIQGVKSFADLAKFTPGVTFNEDRHDVSIRGIESTAGSGTTGIYIDDTPIQMRALGLNANNTLPAVFDLQRVEVLRGPQGTLFGAGSEGGTVRYITTQPSLSDFSGMIHAEGAQTETGAPSYEFGGAYGGPIVQDKLGFRLSAWGRHDGGWVDRTDNNNVGGVDKNANRTDTYVLRGALTWAVTPNLSITPSMNYEKRDQHNHDEYWVSTSNPGNGQYNSGTPDRMADKDRFYLPAVKIDWDLGPVKLIANTSYYNRRERVNGYSGTLYNLSYFEHFTTATTTDEGGNTIPAPTDPQGATPAGCTGSNYGQVGCITGNLLNANGLNLPGFGPYVSTNWITNTQENFTQEVRLQSNTPGARLTWTAGVFYAHNSQRSTEEIRDQQLNALSEYLWGEDILTAWGDTLLPNGDDYINDTKAHDRQVALFADATYKITDALKLNVGLRYAWTHFDYHNINGGSQDLLCGAGGVSIPDNCSDGIVVINGHPFNSVKGGKDETPFTPKVSLSYQFNSDDMAYATFSKGYRIGGATPPLPAAACGGTFPTEYNSDTVTNYEIGSKDRFFDRKLQVSGSVYYIEWKNIQQAIYVPTCGIQFTANAGNAVSQGFDLQGQWQVTPDFDLELSVGYTDAHYTGNAIEHVSGSQLAAKGDVLDVVPWTVTLGAQYNLTINDHDAFVRADYEYNSHRNKPIPTEDPANPDFYDSGLVPNPAYSQMSARAGMTVDKWDLAFYVNNLFNDHPQLNLQHQDNTTALYEATTLRPRTFGIELNRKF